MRTHQALRKTGTASLVVGVAAVGLLISTVPSAAVAPPRNGVVAAAVPVAAGPGAVAAQVDPVAANSAPDTSTSPSSAAQFAATSAPNPRAPYAPRTSTQPLSGSLTSGGHYVTWLISGTSPVPVGVKALESFDAVVYEGESVGFTGGTSYTLEAGYGTNLRMAAGINASSYLRLPGDSKEFDKRVGGGTYSLPFAMRLNVPVSKSTIGYQESVRISLLSRNCNDSGVCGGPSVSWIIAILHGKKPVPDTVKPIANIAPIKGFVPIGYTTPVKFGIRDNSYKATWYVNMYSAGTIVAKGSSKGLVKAAGQVVAGAFSSKVTGTGPFYVCVWAEDAAGNKSQGAPKSSCTWVSREVPIEAVANGCGADWGPWYTKVQNWFLDKQYYGGNLVYVRPACNLHDAGYAGATVRDPYLKKLVDYRTWTRAQVDAKFYRDIRSQCVVWLNNPKGKPYLARCMHGVSLNQVLAIVGYRYGGALAYYQGVRRFGHDAFDTNPTIAGVQTEIPDRTLPAGGARSNA